MPSSPPVSWADRGGQFAPTVRGPEPRQDRSVRTRNVVLLTAAELFAANGFRDTSIKDVADSVGMTKGAVYHHFPSKEILAISVVEEHYRRWPILLEEVRAQDLSPLATAQALLDKVAEAFRSDAMAQAGARLQLERSLIGAPLPAPYVGWAELLSGILQEAKEQGELRSEVDPGQAARTVIATFFGMQHISDTLNRRSDLTERWAESRELLFFSIRAA